jgi:hypothetical protein
MPFIQLEMLLLLISSFRCGTILSGAPSPIKPPYLVFGMLAAHCSGFGTHTTIILPDYGILLLWKMLKSSIRDLVKVP